MEPQPIETAPKDRPVLVYGRYSWESLDPKSRHIGWLVAKWNPELTTNYDSDELEWVGGFQSITANPYKDYILATHWVELPAMG